MAKLENVKSVRQMLAGEHRSQNRTSVAFFKADTERAKYESKEMAEGEIREIKDALGNTVEWWEMSNGIKIRYNVHPEVSKAFQELRNLKYKFSKCPKEICTCTVPTSLDEKFRWKTGMCADCTISYETRLKMQGKFDEYANLKLKANAESFLRDADVEIEKLKDSIRNVHFVDETGVETWSADNVEYYVNQLDEQYAKYKRDVMSKVTLP